MIVAPRMAALFGLWLVLSDAAWGGLPFGLLAAWLACWASMRLRPPGPGMSVVQVVRLVGRAGSQAVLGGVDIAWRAFQPRMPLQPGLVRYTPTLPAGVTRDLFTAICSLAPGALPAGLDSQGHIILHVLDTRQDAVAAMAGTEALFPHG